LFGKSRLLGEARRIIQPAVQDALVQVVEPIVAQMMLARPTRHKEGVEKETH
jgi:hypothetical protein